MHLPFYKAVLLAGLAATVQAAQLAIEVKPVFDGRAMQLDSLKYRTSAGETIGLSRFGLLLSGFSLQGQDGDWIDMEPYVFIDAAARRYEARLGNLPAGRYSAIRFHVGPAPEANHSNPAQYAANHPLNPVLNNLLWDWQSGYIFLALEGRYRNPDQAFSGYALHYANDWNRVRIELPLDLDARDPTTLHLQFDISALLDSISLSTDGHITHSRKNDPLSQQLKENLPAAFSIAALSSFSAPPVTAEPVEPLYLPDTYEPYRFTMDRSYPVPPLPRDNPLTTARVELGKKLFNDTLLSRNRSIGCFSCHAQANAFTDARPVSRGVGDATGTLNAMPLFNLAWKQNFFWDGRAPSLRDQVLQPITNRIELANDFTTVVDRLQKHPQYPALFAKAFNPPAPTPEKISLALEAYLLTLVSGHSRFDEARQGKGKLTPQEARGMELFFTEYDPRTRQYGADCFHCHGGAFFSDHLFHNNGLEQTDEKGRYKVTRQARDRFRFSTPSLRNVELTAPYMHDGRFKTLEEVINHYTSPMQPSDTLDPNLAKHPRTGLQLSESDKAALVAFLKTLTDPQYQ